jgi:dihydroorotate dehydrogenase electron transfer subunit
MPILATRPEFRMDSHQFFSSIKEQEEVSPGYFLLSIELPGHVKRPQSGQFFMIKVGMDKDPLLRRPFSLHRLISEDTFQILYRVKGKGTKILSERRHGEKLDILGPLGGYFEIPSYLDEAILVAGGIGVAPLLSLAEEFRRLRKSVKLILGGKGKEDILCEKELETLGVEIFISTEDGSYGRKGLVTELFEDHLKVQSSELRAKGSELKTPNSKLKTQVYACGPRPMLKKVSDLARTYSLFCFVSFEERMACGVGACLGCAVKTNPPSPPFAKGGKGGIYKMVCKDGPVFNAEEIDWDG